MGIALVVQAGWGKKWQCSSPLHVLHHGMAAVKWGDQGHLSALLKLKIGAGGPQYRTGKLMHSATSPAEAICLWCVHPLVHFIDAKHSWSAVPVPFEKVSVTCKHFAKLELIILSHYGISVQGYPWIKNGIEDILMLASDYIFLHYRQNEISINDTHSSFPMYRHKTRNTKKEIQCIMIDWFMDAALLPYPW